MPLAAIDAPDGNVVFQNPSTQEKVIYMTIKMIGLLSAVTLIAAAPALKAEDKYKADSHVEVDSSGNVEKKTYEEKTDAAGKRSIETKTEVDVDSNGDTEKTTKTEEVNDPKGLMNKKKTVTTDSVKEDGNKVIKKHKKRVNGTTVEENTTEHKN